MEIYQNNRVVPDEETGKLTKGARHKEGIISKVRGNLENLRIEYKTSEKHKTFYCTLHGKELVKDFMSASRVDYLGDLEGKHILDWTTLNGEPLGIAPKNGLARWRIEVNKRNYTIAGPTPNQAHKAVIAERWALFRKDLPGMGCAMGILIAGGLSFIGLGNMLINSPTNYGDDQEYLYNDQINGEQVHFYETGFGYSNELEITRSDGSQISFRDWEHTPYLDKLVLETSDGERESFHWDNLEDRATLEEYLPIQNEYLDSILEAKRLESEQKYSEVIN